MNQIINIVMRMVMRLGVNKLIDFASRRGKPRAELDANERESARNTRQSTHRLRRGMNFIRRIGRF